MLHLKLSFAKTAKAKRSSLLLLALALTGLSPFAGNAQKIDSKKVFTTFKKAPVMQLKPEFNTYSVEYNFGALPVQPKETPELQDLKYLKTGGDLNLKISAAKLFIADKTQKIEGVKETPTPKPGAKPQKAAAPKEDPKYYSTVTYLANYGYELFDKKSESTIHAYKKKTETFNTPTFNSTSELDAYLKNNLNDELLNHILSQTNKRIKYDFGAPSFDVRVGINSIVGPSPEFAEINKASTDFTALISEKTPQKEALQPQIAIWEKHLAKADWAGKTGINKRVANALIENLCAAHMLTNDFGKLKEKIDLYEKNNPGAAGKATALAFEIDSSYPGSISTMQAIKRKDKMQNFLKYNYPEFASNQTGG